MSHLEESGLTYFQHLHRAWTIAFVCFMHGLIPWIWKNKAKDIINGDPKDFR